VSDFLMPSLGADMDAGTLLEWYVKPGDAVKRGDIVALVDTSKAEIEIEIFEDGVIDELLVPAGARVPVGTPLARVRSASAMPEQVAPKVATPAIPPQVAPDVATPAEPEAVAPDVAAAAVPAPVPEHTRPPVPAGEREHRVRISPLARRVAEQLGVEPATVTGTGPHGAITRIDVEHAAAAYPNGGPPRAEETEPAPPAAASVSPMREAIAALMARSKREIPHYYLQLDIDLSTALTWLHEQNLRRPVTERLLPSVLLLSAVARAVSTMPELNGFWIDAAFRPGSGVHLGVAISLRGGGLIAPALHDADRMALDEIMLGVRDLVRRARAGRLRGSEMADPTITVTNLGEHGVDLVHGVIYAPQVALVGFGGVRERPWAADGMLGVRPVVTATLAADHRASDGHTGSRLLALINRHLQNPEEL
jgi:pyruvate dehydrogenase E2 component (dihydrolipoamide acetyltransferase)